MTLDPRPGSPSLPEALGELSAALSRRHPQDPNQLRQPQADPLRAHAEAQRYLNDVEVTLGQ